MMPDWIERLIELGVECPDALDWATTQPDAETAWQQCHRGEWMAWYLGRVAAGEIESPERDRLVLCLCDIARPALQHIQEKETRPKVAIETAENHASGGGHTLSEVRHAADAVFHAIATCASPSAVYAAYVASLFADICVAYATHAASVVRNVAHTAYRASVCAATDPSARFPTISPKTNWRADADAAEETSLRASADTIRKHYPELPNWRTDHGDEKSENQSRD